VKYWVVASERTYRVRTGGVDDKELYTPKVSEAVCVRDRDFPVNVTVPFALATPSAAVNVICCGVPGVMEMSVGENDTPAGKPVTCTLTCEENPFSAVTVRDTGVDCPATTELAAGFTDMEKSAVGGGCPPPLFPPPPFPPQATISAKKIQTIRFLTHIRRNRFLVVL